MSLARRVIEKRRRKTIGVAGKADKKAWNDTGERLESADGRDQRYSTHGHKLSERASEIQKNNMVEHRTDNHSAAHRRKRRIIHGGTHGNDYMPAETRGEL